MYQGGNQEFASPAEALAHISIDDLLHFGVKGMRWGVRKERQPKPELKSLLKDGPITRTTKNGDEFTLSQVPPNWLQKGLASVSKSYREQYKQSAYLSIKDKNDKKIGAANFWHKGPDTVYLNWITINKHSRGNGYASAVLKAAEDHSRAAGKKRMVLEVPGDAPDARHIYEKMGFEVTGHVGSKDDIWGGLTSMEKKLV
jgi:ribosomal protein S18 acetylase RimI-like enzyme